MVGEALSCSKILPNTFTSCRHLRGLKCAKVALAACMRELLAILNTVIRTRTAWGRMPPLKRRWMTRGHRREGELNRGGKRTCRQGEAIWRLTPGSNSNHAREEGPARCGSVAVQRGSDKNF